MFGWLKSKFARADFAATPISNPADWLFDALGAVPSHSGVVVSREKALTYSAVFRCIEIIANDVAKLPLIVYRREGRGKERDHTHPLYRVLHDAPNPEMSSFTFRKTMQAHLLQQANAYAYIERRRGGDLSLWPIDPMIVEPKRDEAKRLKYKVHLEDGTLELDADEVLHLRGLSHDGVVGLVVLYLARQSIGWGLAMQQFSATFFARNSVPPLLFKAPPGVGKEGLRDFLQKWAAQAQGLDNAHKVQGLLNDRSGEWTTEKLSIPAKDAQLIEALQLNVRDVANWFGVPSHLVGDVEKVAYNSLREENASYQNRTLNGHLSNWEAELTRALVPESQRDEVVIEFSRGGLLEADVETQSQVLERYLRAKIMTPNEVRALLNLNPIEGGDEFRESAQPAPADDADPLNARRNGRVPSEN